MEIATCGIGRQHEALVDAFRQAGIDEPIGRWEDLDAAAREEIKILFGWRITQEVVESCPNLAWIQGAGAGVDWLLPVKIPESVVVTRIVDHFGPDMGEYALLAALAWVKDWRRIAQGQADSTWSPYLVGSLSALTVGVLGAGSIGSHIAGMFQPLVHEVRALGRKRPGLPGVRGYAADEWDMFFDQLDVLVMVLPHTPDTYHAVGAAEIARMKRGGYLINVGRGAVLDTEALVAAVQAGQLSGAALDVVETEPLPPESPLWTLPGVTISPHISGPSRPDGMVAVFSENLSRFRGGRPMMGVVDWERGY